MFTVNIAFNAFFKAYNVNIDIDIFCKASITLLTFDYFRSVLARGGSFLPAANESL